MKQLGMSLILIVVIAVGGWALMNRSKIDDLGDAVELAREQVGEVVELPSFGLSASSEQAMAGDPQIRMATLNLAGKSKLDDTPTLSVITELIARFDLIAVQEVPTDPILLGNVIEQLNQRGRHFDLIVSPRVGRLGTRRQYGFIFDVEKIQLDGAQRYLIQDPDQLFRQPPFVGWFRVRTGNPDRAFTFTVVNVQLDGQNSINELRHLNEVFRAVRSDGRGEDDVIVVGDFQCDDAALSSLASTGGLRPIVMGSTTDTMGTKQWDNILIDPNATVEFTMRGGVFDFMNVFNLTLNQALEVSPRLPVWAEFSIIEGGPSQKFAEQANGDSFK